MGRYRKALVAAAMGAIAAEANALPDGITGQEWMTILAAAVVAGCAVWAVPNRPAGRP